MKVTYLQSIRKFCLDCMGGSSDTVKDCPSRNCKFYPYRFGKTTAIRPGYSPLKAIRLYCLECVGNSDEVKKCSMPECPVYYYRQGHNPKLKGRGDVSNLRNKRHQNHVLASNLNDHGQTKVNIPVLTENRL